MPRPAAEVDELVVEPLRPQPLGDRHQRHPGRARPGAGPVPVGLVRQGDDDAAALGVRLAQPLLVRPCACGATRSLERPRRAAGTTRTSSGGRTARPRASARPASSADRSGRTRARLPRSRCTAAAVALVQTRSATGRRARRARSSGSRRTTPPAGDEAGGDRLLREVAEAVRRSPPQPTSPGRRRGHGSAPERRGERLLPRTTRMRCTTVIVLATASSRERDRDEPIGLLPDPEQVAAMSASPVMTRIDDEAVRPLGDADLGLHAEATPPGPARRT